ncbi:hypothetical protein BU26DRAFT_174109 [Trematosphaeria pertusa]|uniref:Osmotin, thaumatin-like protein n=1 Tax=Trematosphaeria pertusa TaxID=390896 RepID=A0A6A6HV13_9PLEO|nr:uncharacterized protein BU26DRAFT_174109 [Trematosphaeria pertusa]KAF2241598.1 hypothetical protein BU26DRAFT_174109 [Trematosphaeria pertusa]
MRWFVTAACLLACLFAGIARAANTVKIVNHCPYDLFFWVVGPGWHVLDEQHIIVPGNHGSVIHGMIDTTGTGGGISLKMRDVPRYAVAPAGILQAEYKFEPATHSIWYDFSAIDCNKAAPPDSPDYCPFSQGGVKMWVPGADPAFCPVAQCLPGLGCERTYLDHGSWHNEPSFRCDIGHDILFETCTHLAAPKTHVVDDDELQPWIPLYPPLPPSPSPSPPPPPPPPPPPTPALPALPQPPMFQQPPTYPPPPDYPSGTICYDPDCLCYSTTQPYLWPDSFPDNTPQCPGYWPYTSREEYKCQVHGACASPSSEEDSFWKRRMLRIHQAVNGTQA